MPAPPPPARTRLPVVVKEEVTGDELLARFVNALVAYDHGTAQAAGAWVGDQARQALPLARDPDLTHEQRWPTSTATWQAPFCVRGTPEI